MRCFPRSHYQVSTSWDIDNQRRPYWEMFCVCFSLWIFIIPPGSMKVTVLSLSWLFVTLWLNWDNEHDPKELVTATGLGWVDISLLSRLWADAEYFLYFPSGRKHRNRQWESSQWESWAEFGNILRLRKLESEHNVDLLGKVWLRSLSLVSPPPIMELHTVCTGAWCESFMHQVLVISLFVCFLLLKLS